MNKVMWLIQCNGGNDKEYMELSGQLNALRIPFSGFAFTAFSDDLPTIPVDVRVICRGSIEFVIKIFNSQKWQPGAFFDHDRFKFSVWSRQYGEHTLNKNGILTTFRDLVKLNHDKSDRFFIRPDNDTKAFKGTVCTFAEINEWVREMCMEDRLTADEQIIVAPEQRIEEEWRCFMVAGKVSAATPYGRSPKKNSTPVSDDILEFAIARNREWCPAPVYSLDVARTSEGLKLVEVGCFNASGFYRANIRAIIEDVTNFVASKND